MTLKQARIFLGYMIGRLGGGYHPDDPIDEYVNVRTGKRTFSPDEAKHLQELHNKMWDAFRRHNKDVYKEGLKFLRKIAVPEPKSQWACPKCRKSLKDYKDPCCILNT